jgi:MYXO-CTERM domain-containing protein
MRSARFLAVLAVAVVLLDVGSVSADIPGARISCAAVASGHGCDTCVRDYGDPDAGTFDACTAAAVAKGFVSACLERQFKVETTYFCPAGAVKPSEVTPSTGGRGCGGCTCTLTSASAASTLPALGLLALAALRRRRSS